MLVVVKMHRLGVDGGLERIVGVGQRWEFVGTGWLGGGGSRGRGLCEGRESIERG